MRIKYYSLKNIDSYDALYNIIFGERSNGKTYAALKKIIDNYFERGEQGGYIRRYREDFRGKRGQTLFMPFVNNDYIAKASKGEWTGVYFYGSQWYFCRNEKNKVIKDDKPFCFAFALTEMEHDKSTSYEGITTVVFDEFLSRQAPLANEFVLFQNTLSTIIRMRENVKIYMLGNTVNQYSVYFNEMGLRDIKSMKQGEIRLYTYGDTGLTVAVEYADSPNKVKPSDKYFAFDNAALQMITGGKWEINIYPHLPLKYKPKNVRFTYFIIFDNQTVQAEIVEVDNALFTYFHRKTTPIQNPDKDIIFTPQADPRPNWNRKITRPSNPITKKIAATFNEDCAFYQDNELGELIRNYLLWCNSASL